MVVWGRAAVCACVSVCVCVCVTANACVRACVCINACMGAGERCHELLSWSSQKSDSQYQYHMTHHTQHGGSGGGGGRTQQECGNKGTGCRNHKVLDCMYGVYGPCCVAAVRNPRCNVSKHSKNNKHK